MAMNRSIILCLCVCLACLLLSFHSNSQINARVYPYVKPEPHNTTVHQKPKTWQQTMELAEVYHRGDFPRIVPRQDIAIKVYDTVIANCPNKDIAALALVRKEECKAHPIGEKDVQGNQLLGIIDFDDIEEDEQNTIPNDSQSAHDHGVVTAVRQTLEILRRNSITSNFKTAHEDTRNEVEQHLGRAQLDMSDEEIAKALVVVDSLTPEELEALHLVWTEMKPMGDNATETLCKQLASAHEKGNIVCSTGKLGRIVTALDGISESHTTAKPMWVLKEELGSLAAKIRDEGGDGQLFAKKARASYPHIQSTILDPLVQVYAEAF